ncbi:MAG: HD-GYP domain-containing protein [Acidobacteria bacterium]|nr:HD-GYP domain-containing protein [Acidobacteriota bacterium]
MTTPAEGRLQQYAEVVQRLSGALRSAVLYSISHPSVGEHISGLLAAVHALHQVEPVVLIGFIGGEVIADNTPLLDVTTHRAELIQYMQALGINRLVLDRGVTLDEITTFVQAVVKPVQPGLPGQEADRSGTVDLDFVKLPHLRAGRIPVDVTSGQWGSRAITIRQVYSGSVESARMIWESTRLEGTPDAPVAHETVEHLAEAVDSSSGMMIGLTGMKQHDEYTFTHMVNVSILTMAQARTLGVGGHQLRVLGLAAMLHDIGKVRAPLEILNKPSALTPAEFTIMKRHTTDGAAILRAAHEMPRLAAIVAFEHHLRQDGTGYPAGLTRESLNLGSVLCAISDTYDAMRSQRSYNSPSPAHRIASFMMSNDGSAFDKHLVRRFIDLMGIFPPGTLVRLTSGEIAVVVANDGPDPSLPTVNVLFDVSGARLPTVETRSLWGDASGAHEPDGGGIESVVDAAAYDLDPIGCLQTP